MLDSLSGSLPSSLYCDLFYSNPGADEFRREYIEVWIRVHLVELGDRDESAVAEAFCQAYPGCIADAGLIHSTCERLIKLGLVARSGQLLSITADGRIDVTSARARFDASRRRFLDALIEVVSTQTSPPVAGEERSLVEKAVERFVIRCLMEQRSALELLFSQSREFEELTTIGQSRVQQLTGELKALVGTAAATRIIELRRAILGAFPGAIERARNYLHTLHRSVLGAFFLIKDPQHVSNIRDIVRARSYYLDTNVYLAWFYKSQSAHGVVKVLLDLMVRYGVKLKVLSDTVKEIQHIEDVARSSARRISSEPGMTNYLVRERKAIFADYYFLQQRDKNLTWAAFEKTFMGAERMLGLNNVEIVTVQYEEKEDFPHLLSTFRNAISGCKSDAGRVATEDSLDHDASAMLAMAKIQQRGDRDSWGSKHRFLSLDSSLSQAIREIRNATNKRIDHIDNPFVLAGLLIPTTTHAVSREEYEEYVIASVQQSVGTAVEMRGFGDLYLIERLQQAGLPVPTLLEVPGNLLEGALADLQGRRSLGKKLDQAISSKNPQERAVVVAEIQRDLTEALALRSELLQETEAKLLEEQDKSRGQAEEIGRLATQVQQLQLEAAAKDKRLEESAINDSRDRETLRKRLRWLTIAFATTVLLLAVLMVLILTRE